MKAEETQETPPPSDTAPSRIASGYRNIDEVISTPQIIAQAQDLGYARITPLQAMSIPEVLAGKDVVVQGPRRGRSFTYILPLAEIYAHADKGRTFVICDHDGDADKVGRWIQDFGVSVARVGTKQRGGKGALQNARVVVGTTMAFLNAFDEGLLDGAQIIRAIVDGAEPAIQSGRVDELLNLLHDLDKAQIILVRNDANMNIINFIKKFLKSPSEIILDEHAITEDDQAHDAPRGGSHNQKSSRESSSSRTAPSETAPGEASITPPAARAKKLPTNAQHQYIELGADLLAKPNALGDIIESEGSRGVVVFCNSPSEADLTDVMLRKRGIATRKLVGFVSPQRCEAAVTALQAGEISAIVVTDISARDLTIAGLSLVIHYSPHSDPEVYQQRGGIALDQEKPVRLISLVTPLDLANFHSLKKFIACDIQKVELPSKETILAAKVRAISEKAKEKPYAQDERIQTYLKLLSEAPNKDEIFALLVHNTVDALPAALAAAERGNDRGPERESREGFEREGRRGGRHDRGDRRRDDRRERYADNAGSEEYPRNGTEHDTPHRRRDRRDEGSSESFTPPSRDIRLYVGSGSSDGYTNESLLTLARDHSGLTTEQVKRVIVRKLYSFIDVAEEGADNAVAKLSEVDCQNGKKLLVKKAVTITAPREADKSTNDEGTSGGTSSSLPPTELAGRDSVAHAE